jgi:hypothetical protein
MREPHGVVRGHGIEVGGRDVALLRVLSFVPTASSHPLARLEPRHVLGDALLYLGDRLHRCITKIDGEQRVGSGEMDVRVDEPRRDGPTAKVDHFGRAADAGLDLIRRAGGRDLAGGDGDRLDDGVSIVDRDDRAVDEREVRGRLSVRPCLAGPDDQRTQQGDRGDAAAAKQTHD